MQSIFGHFLVSEFSTAPAVLDSYPSSDPEK
jgi:hypothetical protein